MEEVSLFNVFQTPREGFSAANLKHVYYDLMKKAHPDSSFALPREEKEKLSSFINSSYNKLRDDYARSVYEYSLKNNQNLIRRRFDGAGKIFGLGDPLVVVDSEKERVGCDRKSASTEFLDSVLSMEEEILNGTAQDRERVQRKVEEEIEKCKQNSTDLQELVKWRYYRRLQDALKQKDLE